MRTLSEDIVVATTKTSLSELTFLHLEGRDIEKLTDCFEKCLKLVSLSLRNNQLRSSLISLKRCSELWFLDLSNNALTSLDGLQHFTALGYLDISCNNIPLHELKRIEHLESIHLSLHGNLPLQRAFPPKSYRSGILSLVGSTWVLDGHFVHAEEREKAVNEKKKKAAGLDSTAAEGESLVDDEGQLESSLYKWDGGGSLEALASMLSHGELATRHLQLVKTQPSRRPRFQDCFRLRQLASFYDDDANRFNEYVKRMLTNGSRSRLRPCMHLQLLRRELAHRQLGSGRPGYFGDEHVDGGGDGGEESSAFLHGAGGDDQMFDARAVRLDLLVVLAGSLLWPSVPRQVLFEASTVLLGPHVSSPGAMKELSELPPFAKSALCFALRADLLEEVAAVPEGPNALAPHLIALLHAVPEVIVTPAIDSTPPATSPSSSSLSLSSAPNTEAVARRAAILFSRAPSCPPLVASRRHSSVTSQKVYEALDPLLVSAGFSASDLRMSFNSELEDGESTPLEVGSERDDSVTGGWRDSRRSWTEERSIPETAVRSLGGRSDVSSEHFLPPAALATEHVVVGRSNGELSTVTVAETDSNMIDNYSDLVAEHVLQKGVNGSAAPTLAAHGGHHGKRLQRGASTSSSSSSSSSAQTPNQVAGGRGRGHAGGGESVAKNSEAAGVSFDDKPRFAAVAGEEMDEDDQSMVPSNLLNARVARVGEKVRLHRVSSRVSSPAAGPLNDEAHPLGSAALPLPRRRRSTSVGDEDELAVVTEVSADGASFACLERRQRQSVLVLRRDVFWDPRGWWVHVAAVQHPPISARGGGGGPAATAMSNNGERDLSGRGGAGVAELLTEKGRRWDPSFALASPNALSRAPSPLPPFPWPRSGEGGGGGAVEEAERWVRASTTPLPVRVGTGRVEFAQDVPYPLKPRTSIAGKLAAATAGAVRGGVGGIAAATADESLSSVAPSTNWNKASSGGPEPSAQASDWEVLQREMGTLLERSQGRPSWMPPLPSSSLSSSSSIASGGGGSFFSERRGGGGGGGAMTMPPPIDVSALRLELEARRKRENPQPQHEEEEEEEEEEGGGGGGGVFSLTSVASGEHENGKGSPGAALRKPTPNNQAPPPSSSSSSSPGTAFESAAANENLFLKFKKEEKEEEEGGGGSLTEPFVRLRQALEEEVDAEAAEALRLQKAGVKPWRTLASGNVQTFLVDDDQALPSSQELLVPSPLSALRELDAAGGGSGGGDDDYEHVSRHGSRVATARRKFVAKAKEGGEKSVLSVPVQRTAFIPAVKSNVLAGGVRRARPQQPAGFVLQPVSLSKLKRRPSGSSPTRMISGSNADQNEGEAGGDGTSTEKDEREQEKDDKRKREQAQREEEEKARAARRMAEDKARKEREKILESRLVKTIRRRGDLGKSRLPGAQLHHLPIPRYREV